MFWEDHKKHGEISSNRKFLKGFWQRIAIAPGLRLPRDKERQTKQLSFILLAITIIGIWFTLDYAVEVYPHLERVLPDIIITGIALMGLLGLFFLNRQGYFGPAARGTVLFIIAVIYLSAFPNAQTNEAVMLYYLAIPVVLSGLMLTVPFTIFTGALTVAGVIVFPLLTHVSPDALPLSTTFLITLFTILAAYQRQKVEEDRLKMLKDSEDRYQHLSTHDYLTDLPNRRLFMDLLTSAINRHTRNDTKFVLILINFDNFKDINDAMTTTGGDQLIILFAQRLESVLRDSDSIARCGGDEFGVVVEQIETSSKVYPVLEKIQTQFSDPFFINGKEVFLTASIGLSIFPDDGTTGEVLYQQSISALIEAKKVGKNSAVFYSPVMNRETSRRIELAGDLRRALGNGELHVLYQPQVEADSGKIIAAESLLRWHHPTLGIVSPGLFIPIAEETGIITDITAYVLEEVSKRFARGREGKDKRELGFSLNISGKDVRDPQLFPRIEGLLKEGNIPPELLELELTENIIYKEIENARDILFRLKDLGVRIAVDDFGSGFTTLRQLASFPVDRIKIDKSFSDNLPRNLHDQAVVAGIMEIARRKNISVVAEGVETKAQLEAYRALGCTVIQGWYYSKAVDVEALERMLQENFSFY